MAQITDGIRSILSNPHVYDFFQKVMGAASFRERFTEEFIRCQGGERILDLGCGTADILAYLPNAIDYHGYDISEEYIASAKNIYGNLGSFKVGIFDEDTASTMGKFDVVLVLGVLHHLDDDTAKELFSSAYVALKPAGRLVSHDPCYVQGQNPLAKYLVSKDRGQNIRYPESYKALASSSFNKVAYSVKNRLLPTPYTHCFLECRR